MVVNVEIVKMKKKVGRPARDAPPGTVLQPRFDDDFLVRIDDWRRDQPDMPSRTEALRRLAALALDAEAKKRGRK